MDSNVQLRWKGRVHHGNLLLFLCGKVDAFPRAFLLDHGSHWPFHLVKDILDILPCRFTMDISRLQLRPVAVSLGKVHFFLPG